MTSEGVACPSSMHPNRFKFQTARFGCASASSWRDASELCMTSPLKTEGAGNAGCPPHPQPRVRNSRAHEQLHHRFTGATQRFLRNGFNGLFRALPGDRAFLPPSSAEKSRQLDASVGASGPHGFAVRKSAPSSLALPASTASCSAFVTCARPSVGQDGESYSLICISEKQKYFLQTGLDKDKVSIRTDLPVGQNQWRLSLIFTVFRSMFLP
jgi:hypothetical protein